jgi:hypothetical protein
MIEKGLIPSGAKVLQFLKHQQPVRSTNGFVLQIFFITSDNDITLNVIITFFYKTPTV